MESPAAPRHEDPRAALRRELDRLEHVLPGQAPIRDFVHHNTLHGYQHLPFGEAVAEAARRTGHRGFLPLGEFRELLRRGRILERDLEEVVEEYARLRPAEAVSAGLDGLRRAQAYLAALRHPLHPVAPATLRFAMEELEARSRFQPDVPEAARRRLQGDAPERDAVSGLWRACLETLELDYAPRHPETLRETAATTGDAQMRAQAEALLERLMGGVGRDATLRALLRALTGEDVLGYIRPLLLRHLAAHLDQGMAAWHNPGRGGGLYAAWRASARDDLVWSFIDLPEWSQITERLPDDALDTIIQELRLLGVPEDGWAAYLERLALELPGWAGMFAWRERRPGYSGSEGVPVELADYLAVRLVLERVFVHGMCRRRWRVEPTLPAIRWHFRHHPAELLVRHAVFNERLPEHLLTLGRRLTQQATFSVEEVRDDHWEDAAHRIAAWRADVSRHPEGLTPHGSAWPLFRLCQHLGLSGERLRAAGPAGARALLDCLARLDADTAGYLWLLAYERRYRDQILGALAANHGRGASPANPQGQLVFCMDDREEGIRRHLEEANPALETFGAAGFFGVAVNWRGLDDATVTPLCPVVVTPAHEAREEPRPGAEETVALHRHRRGVAARGRALLHQQTRRGVFAAAAVTAAAAPGALAALAAKVLAPGAFGPWSSRLRARFEVQVPTAVAFGAPADSPPATPERPRLGFTDAEQADRVQGLLRTIGLASGFAPLVAILGHGSASQNNPHLSAYDCGACSGRHGGPNARLFAAMANRPEVREVLAQRGLAIPEGTRFIGGERNTCDDTVAWFDTDLLPPSHRPLLEKLDADLAQAARHHARERCRRFASAPAAPSPEQAQRHVAARSHDFSQARPELGHVTNAAAFIGRRALSRGAFFDRRAFLISYDPAQDPEGRVLEAILLAAGPVGAGISLEYYFSTVNNERYGCGTKVVHNVTGLLGVMEGANSDLRTGLPRQMIEIHEAMRLLVVAEHRTEVLDALCARQPVLEELIGKGWVQLAAKDPESAGIHVFEPGRGWRAWAPRDGPPPMVERSTDWYDGHCDALPPALLRRPLAAPGGPQAGEANS